MRPSSQITGATITLSPEDAAALRESDHDQDAEAGARAVQRALGGSMVDQFQSLQAPPPPAPWWKQFTGAGDMQTAARPYSGPAPANIPPGHWMNWSPQPPTGAIMPATAEFQNQDPKLRKVAVLRATAAELDGSANRLEEFELYPQADGLRRIAQQMRVSARQLARGDDFPDGTSPRNPDESPMPTTSWSDPPRQPQLGANRPSGPGWATAEDAASADHAESAGHAVPQWSPTRPGPPQ
jgi:hypothetical protein